MNETDLISLLTDNGATGVLVAILFWFARRFERILERSIKVHDAQNRALVRLLDRVAPDLARAFNRELDGMNGDG